MLVLAACGGGEGAGSDTSKSINRKVIDGYIGGATVCFDRNSNNHCDAGEPTAVTDVYGNYTLTLLPSESTAGKQVIAMTGVGATDADAANGPVTTPYAMFAPAASAATVKPLTTMVSSLMIGDPGLSTSQAEQQVVVSNNLGGLAPNGVLGVDVARSADLNGFLTYSQSNLQYIVLNCAVAFKVSAWNPGTGRGTINWYSNANTNLGTGCTQRQISAQPVGNSDFAVRSYPASGLSAVRFMTYSTPAIFRIANSSNQVYGVFAEWVNPSTQQKQIHQGDYQPVGLTQQFPSSFNMPLFSNPTTVNSLLTQRCVASYPYP